MFMKLCSIMIIIMFLKCSLTTRRIVNGQRVKVDKKFMVYLIKSEKSDKDPSDNWLCGGSIVSPQHVLTSAACLTDATYLYVIAGYEKYVISENLDLDPCTRERKQRVIKTCIPERYSINYSSAHDWGYMDIGIAVVEKPYNFMDETYRRHCSYTPAPIRVNFDLKYEEVDTDVLLLGWGHARGLRQPGDYLDYNQPFLLQTTSRIVETKYCEQYFKYLNQKVVTGVSFICCTGKGYLDEEGAMEGPDPDNKDGCSHRKAGTCGDPLDYDYGFDEVDSTHSKDIVARRQGLICQNDHGGPLLTWVGSELTVVGVAITCLYNKNFECIAPHVYSSTYCASMFIQCVTGFQSFGLTRKMCDNIGKESGYVINETEIHWNEIEENRDSDTITEKKATDAPINILRNGMENNKNDTSEMGDDIKTKAENQNENVSDDAEVDDVVIL